MFEYIGQTMQLNRMIDQQLVINNMLVDRIEALEKRIEMLESR